MPDTNIHLSNGCTVLSPDASDDSCQSHGVFSSQSSGKLVPAVTHAYLTPQGRVKAQERSASGPIIATSKAGRPRPSASPLRGKQEKKARKICDAGAIKKPRQPGAGAKWKRTGKETGSKVQPNKSQNHESGQPVLEATVHTQKPSPPTITAERVMTSAERPRVFRAPKTPSPADLLSANSLNRLNWQVQMARFLKQSGIDSLYEIGEYLCELQTSNGIPEKKARRSFDHETGTYYWKHAKHGKKLWRGHDGEKTWCGRPAGHNDGSFGGFHDNVRPVYPISADREAILAPPDMQLSPAASIMSCDPILSGTQ